MNGGSQRAGAGCPRLADLRGFYRGKLPPARIDEITDHLSRCKDCVASLDTIHAAGDTALLPLRLQNYGQEAEFEEFKTLARAIECDNVALADAFQPRGAGLITTSEPVPASIGRYEVVDEIGRGSFGRVFRALDSRENRVVAIKVPRESGATEAQALAEARSIAAWNHPAIVSVFDWGRSDDGRYFLVMQHIDGCSLKETLKSGVMRPRAVAEIAARIARGLHYAHQKGVVHRDVKPANILLQEDGSPFLADFGLSIHDEDQWSHRGEYAGTRPYMAPEQVRGETHRLDGRADIWGLAVVMYEALTGQRPFRGQDAVQVAEEIRHRQPKPLRQIDETIPAELERICLKCLEKHSADRYLTAGDLAADLEHWLSDAASANDNRSTAKTAVGVVPKGLRFFEQEDAGFFLELLPGARDRDGLPESVRFWKLRIQQRSAEATFRVGVLLGPSGSGKSSLVRAGLLPELDAGVTAVVIEAQPQEFESRILRTIRRHFPQLESTASLNHALTALRNGRDLATGKKLLIVIDQFEQWLNFHSSGAASDLAEALRQCDGGRLQALLLVRDDFTIETTRFMEERSCGGRGGTRDSGCARPRQS